MSFEAQAGETYYIIVEAYAAEGTFEISMTCDSFERQLYLWEVDADTAGTDALEFVEAYNHTGATVDFSTEKYFLLFVNGSDDLTYQAVQFTGILYPDGLRLAGNSSVASVVDVFGDNTLQNGPDGVLLVRCDDCTDVATDFPNDTNPGTGATFTSGGGHQVTKIDAIAYDTADPDDALLMSLLGVTAQWDEAANGDSPNESNHRVSPTTWSAGVSSPNVR